MVAYTSDELLITEKGTTGALGLSNMMNPLENYPKTSIPIQQQSPRSTFRFASSVLLIAFGTLIGFGSLLLMSNQFGNTDRFGFVVCCLAGIVVMTGVSLLLLGPIKSIWVGVLVGPSFLAVPFIVYWLAMFVVSSHFRDHQAFAVQGIANVPIAVQMGELYRERGHAPTKILG